VLDVVRGAGSAGSFVEGADLVDGLNERGGASMIFLYPDDETVRELDARG